MPHTANKTSWQPGQSGNPNGAPANGRALQRMVKDAVDFPALIERLQDIALGRIEAPLRMQVQAAEVLLDRGWGKPLTAAEVSIDISDNVQANGFLETVQQLRDSGLAGDIVALARELWGREREKAGAALPGDAGAEVRALPAG